MKHRTLFLCLLYLLMLPTHAETLRADADWWALGSGDGVSIDDQGRLTPARKLTRAVDLDAGAVWDLASFESALWSAWSEPGRLMKLQGGELETVLTLDNDRWISAVTVDADGEPWYAIAPGGTLQNGIDVGAKYVWDLLSLRDGGLLIATGEPGFVRLWNRELSTVLSFTEQESARTLTQASDGTIWIGTAMSGQLWRWDQKTDPFLVGQLPEREIVSLAPDESGGVWILHTTSSSAKKIEKPKAVVAKGEKPKAAESKDLRDTVLSHWSLSAGFREIWQQEKEIPYAMVRQDTDLWVGSGPEGRLRRISAEGRVLEGYTLPVKNISALATGADGGLAIGSSGDGLLAGLLPSRRTRAIWSGPVIDAGAPAQWGRIDATVEGNAHLEVRVGNIEAPDTGWTAWTPIEAGSAALLPVARYGQLRVQLDAGRKQAAAVSDLAWTRTLRNRAPRIRELRAEPVGTIWFSGPSPSRNSGGPVVIGDPVATDSTKRVKPNPRIIVKKAYEPGTQTVVWSAEDADGDSLRASLSLIAADGRTLSLHEGPSLGFHSFDVRALPEGDYLVELKVEDPQGADEFRQGAKFTVDRTAPSIEAKRTATGWRMIVRDADGLRSVDRREGDRWLPMLPLDGIVDGREETFELTEVEGDRPVWIRAVDRSGNVDGSWAGGASSGVSAKRSASIE